MKKTAYIFLFLIAPSLFATDSDIEIRPAAEDFIESAPNQNVTTVLHVTNQSGEDMEFVSDVELPEGWKLITREFPFDLENRQTDMKLLSFYVPQGTPAGMYEIVYRVRSRKYPSISGMAIVNVRIRTYREYRLSVLNRPELVIAGDSLTFQLLIENMSNVQDTLLLQCVKSGNHEVGLDPVSFVLEPKASRPVAVRVETNPELTHDLNQFFQFVLYSDDPAEPAATIQTSIQMLSRTQGPEDSYNRFPVTVSAAFVGQRVDGRTTSGFQGDAEGMGYLDEDRRHHVQFHLRGPDAYQKALSIYAERDEYNAQYSSDFLTLALGDRPYSLSHLTQNASYGRGAEIGLKWTPTLFTGAYYHESRWFYRRQDAWAGYLRYAPSSKTHVQANVIQVDRTDRSGNIVSLSGMTVRNGVKAQGEWAVDVDEGRARQSFEVGLNGSHEKGAVLVRWIYADPEFAGYYRDTNYLSSSISLHPVPKVGFKFMYRSEKQNFELDTTRFSAPLTQYLQTGLNYSFSPQSKLSLDYINQSRKDRLYRLFDYSEESLRLRMNGTLGDFTLSASAETGITKNRIFGRESEMNRYTASVHFKPDARQSYRGYAYWNNSIRYSGEKNRVLTAGFQMRYSISDRFHAQIDLQNNFSPEEYYYDRNQSELLLKWILPNAHRIQLRGRRTYLKNSLNRTDVAYVAEYQAPLGIPVSRKPNTCVVTGRVIDVRTGKPLRDMIIRINGSTAVTDEKGGFVFKNLKKKTYYLTIDKASMGLNRVTIQKSPIEIETVEGKKGIDVQIGVVDGASLSGRVLLQSAPRDRGTDEAGFIVGSGSAVIDDSVSCEDGDYGLENILVEMRKGDEILRRLTDKNGRYEFEELRPGRWTVKFHPRNLPDYHRYEQDIYTVDVEAGSSQTLNACVVPQKRRIRFLQQGETLIQEQKR